MLSLKNKCILVTGVSRSKGIGASIAKTLAYAGANVIVHGYTDYDHEQEYGDANSQYFDELAEDLEKENVSIWQVPSCDLSKNNHAELVIRQAAAIQGHINGLVLNHAHSSWAALGEWTAENIDAHLIVNVRATMLMIQAFADQLPQGMSGSITLFTSGQYLRPMIKEIAYAVSKDAINGLCKQAAVALASKNIRVNCINPGATDTGYLSGDEYKSVAKMFPSGEWLLPQDAARLVHFLQSDYAQSITGQIIASEAGFDPILALEK